MILTSSCGGNDDLMDKQIRSFISKVYDNQGRLLAEYVYN